MTTVLDLSDAEYQEWLHANKVSLGGTAAGAILGINAYKTIRQLYDSLLQLVPPQPDNLHMERGRRLEPIIANLYAERTGRSLLETVKTWHPTCPWLHATPDRLIGPSRSLPSYCTPDDGMDGILEIKAPNARVFDRTRLSGLDPSYYAQGQLYLYLFDRSWLSFAIYSEDADELHFFDLPRNEPFIVSMVAAMSRFWFDHVVPRIPPTQAYGCVGLPTRIGAVAVERTDASWFDAVRELKIAREQHAVATTRREHAEAVVKALMGSETMIVGGGAVIRWSESTRKSLDEAAMQADGIDVERYRRLTVIRSFLPKFTD